ncbi:purine nucleoside phosphorylase-like isoform X1 [Diabrotica virgifera virgifera]|uniref:Purine nucleoside phosphorylase n=1 Tax=Diabrotica virgifera virgifera TaxID=50390 RepID=A0A6P7HE92_DIAVI|nr:purine nucleoside phosphorylase-like isoform X1 [Diabrotica virgifera virgifera]
MNTIFNGNILMNGNGALNGKTNGTNVENGDNGVYTYETLNETAEFLKNLVPIKPKIGIICGSGLGAYWNEGTLADALDQKIAVPYEKIPNFPESTVKGHTGALVFGYIGGVAVVCMKGRFHYYEGYPLWKCAMPVRVMKLLGITHLIATNAAGGLNPRYKVGDIMLIKDHINLMGFAGNNPLQGPNDERFGPRFPPMNNSYDRQLIREAKRIAKGLGLEKDIHEGVYTCLGGPNFETVAELRMLKMWGADTVGMSTVHEVITARHCDLTVLAFSLVTNECLVEYDNTEFPNHEEVLDVGKVRQEVLQKFVKQIIEFIATTKEFKQ